MENKYNINWPKIATFSIASLFFWVWKELILNENQDKNIKILWIILLCLWWLFLIVLFFNYYKKESEKSLEEKYEKIIVQYTNIINNMEKWYNFTNWLQRWELERTSQNTDNGWFITENSESTEI